MAPMVSAGLNEVIGVPPGGQLSSPTREEPLISHGLRRASPGKAINVVQQRFY